MVALQKLACFNLAVIVIGFLVYAVLCLTAGSFSAFHAFAGMCGLLVFGQLFYRRSASDVLVDERDQIIYTRATLMGLWTFWVLFVCACFLIWTFFRHIRQQEQVSIDILPALALGAFVVFVLARSIAMLIQYGRSRNG